MGRRAPTDSEPAALVLAASMTADLGRCLSRLDRSDMQLVASIYGIGCEARTLSELAHERHQTVEDARKQLNRALRQLEAAPEMRMLQADYAEGVRPLDVGVAPRCAHSSCRRALGSAQSTGRPRKFCSNRCRQAAYRARHGLRDLRYDSVPAGFLTSHRIARAPKRSFNPLSAQDPPAEDVIDYLASPILAKRLHALERIPTSGIEPDWAKEILREFLNTDDAPVARRTALKLLAANWPDEPQTIDLLFEHAELAGDPCVRRAALLSLADLNYKSGAALLLLTRMARTDGSGRVRAAAVTAQARLFPHATLTDETLCRVATYDPSAMARAAAVRGLLRGGWTDASPSARDQVRRMLASEKSHDLYAELLSSLAADFDEPAIRDMMAGQIRRNASGRIRRVALHSLASRMPAGRERERHLLDWASEDNDQEVRRIALDLLRPMIDDLSLPARDRIYRLIAGDSSQPVRMAAAALLTDAYRHDPDRLLNWSFEDGHEELRGAAMAAVATYYPSWSGLGRASATFFAVEPGASARAVAAEALPITGAVASLTSHLLAGVIRTDPAEHVRFCAMNRMEQLPVDENLAAVLIWVAENDESMALRHNAVVALTRRHPQDSALANTFGTIAATDPRYEVRRAAEAALERLAHPTRRPSAELSTEVLPTQDPTALLSWLSGQYGR